MIPVENKGVNPPLENGPCDKQGPNRLQCRTDARKRLLEGSHSGTGTLSKKSTQDIPSSELTDSQARVTPSETHTMELDVAESSGAQLFN